MARYDSLLTPDLILQPMHVFLDCGTSLPYMRVLYFLLRAHHASCTLDCLYKTINHAAMCPKCPVIIVMVVSWY